MKIIQKIFIIISLVFILTLVSGCQNPISISMRMTNPEANSNDQLNYIDSNIDISFKPYTTQKGLQAIIFELQNKSDSTIKIIWDEAIIINPDNTVSKVIHKGIRYIDRGKTMTPTILPKGSKTNDNVSPVDNIYWSSGWVEKAIVKDDPLYNRSNLSIVLPLEIGGKRKEYRFDFEVLVIESQTNI